MLFWLHFKITYYRAAIPLDFPNQFMVLAMSLTSFSECARLVSSAYIVTLEHFNAHGKSLL